MNDRISWVETRFGRFCVWFLFPAAIVSSCLWLWSVVGYFPWQTRKAPDAGQFGDSFGYINSLFSSLALGFVIYAVILQMIELGLQRKELKASVDALTTTAEANESIVELQFLSAYLSAISGLSSAHADRMASESEKAVRYSTWTHAQLTRVIDSVLGSLAKRGDGIIGAAVDRADRKALDKLLRTYGCQLRNFVEAKNVNHAGLATHDLVRVLDEFINSLEMNASASADEAVIQDAKSWYENAVALCNDKREKTEWLGRVGNFANLLLHDE